jgi:succinate dehydrogenase hydrophobic anchor subunit
VVQSLVSYSRRPGAANLLGLVGYLRQPGNPVVWWLVGVGVAFGCDIALGDVLLPLAEDHWGATSSITAAIALLHQWAGVFGIDEPARRGLVHRVLRVSTGVVLALLAVLVGRWVSRAECAEQGCGLGVLNQDPA